MGGGNLRGGVGDLTACRGRGGAHSMHAQLQGQWMLACSSGQQSGGVEVLVQAATETFPQFALEVDQRKVTKDAVLGTSADGHRNGTHLPARRPGLSATPGTARERPADSNTVGAPASCDLQHLTKVPPTCCRKSITHPCDMRALSSSAVPTLPSSCSTAFRAAQETDG